MNRSAIETVIENVNASMAMEGMPLTAGDRAMLSRCLSGELSFEQAVRSVVAEYKVRKYA